MTDVSGFSKKQIPSAFRMSALEVAEEKLRDLFTLFDSEALVRIERMLSIWKGELQIDGARFQRPWLLHVPGLTARPWHDPGDFIWRENTERFMPGILGELDALLGDGISQPYMDRFNETLHGLPESEPRSRPQRPSDGPASKDEWTAFHLYRAGRWLDVNARKLPSARKLIETTPYAPGEALCSILEPNGRIALHTGGCNAVLTCHLPLIVPRACGLQVGAEARMFEVGKLIIFDDSFLHRAWNESSERRINLLWEIWHPDLTLAEMRALEELYPILMEFGDGTPQRERHSE